MSLRHPARRRPPRSSAAARVSNYGGDPPFGRIDLATAPQHSVNTAYYRLASRSVRREVAELAHAAGIPDAHPAGRRGTARVGADRARAPAVRGPPAGPGRRLRDLRRPGVPAAPFFVREGRRRAATSCYVAKAEHRPGLLARTSPRTRPSRCSRSCSAAPAAGPVSGGPPPARPARAAKQQRLVRRLHPAAVHRGLARSAQGRRRRTCSASGRGLRRTSPAKISAPSWTAPSRASRWSASRRGPTSADADGDPAATPTATATPTPHRESTPSAVADGDADAADPSYSPSEPTHRPADA